MSSGFQAKVERSQSLPRNRLLLPPIILARISSRQPRRSPKAKSLLWTLPALKDGASIAFANRLHPQSENVDCCIEISVHSQATFRAVMDSFREIFFDYHCTSRSSKTITPKRFTNWRLTWFINLLAIWEGGKARQAYIDSYNRSIFPRRPWDISHLDWEASEPFASWHSANSAGLNLTFNRPMQLDLDISNLGEMEHFRIQLKTRLRVRDAIVSPL